ncbi:MAG TPA: helix-turn-helix transcriptional regulator [Conexibacter sp.]|nr:helix-turn-helix transcriptional regulator [Conexibacter sp.]
MPPPAKRERDIVGAGVRRMREDRTLTQEKVADRGDLGHKYLGQLERGELTPKLDSLIAVARGLGMRPAEFFRGVADAFDAAETGG